MYRQYENADQIPYGPLTWDDFKMLSMSYADHTRVAAMKAQLIARERRVGPGEVSGIEKRLAELAISSGEPKKGDEDEQEADN